MVLGAANYPNAQVRLAADTILDMRGQTSLQVGSVVSSSPTSVIKNFSPDAVGRLVTGADGTDGTFAGLIASDYSSGRLGVTKIGAGAWSLTADNAGSLLETLQVAGGRVVLAGSAARLGFITTILSEGGVLMLDNSTSAVSDRLGGATSIMSTSADRVLSMRGGQLELLGGAVAVTEAINTATLLEGASRWQLAAGYAATELSVNSLAASSTTNRGTLTLDAGTGRLGGGPAGAGRVNVTITTPGLVGNIRPDLIGMDSTGVGLVTHDANGLRLLAAGDTALGYFNPGAASAAYLGTSAPAAVVAAGGVVANAAAGSNVDLTSQTGLYAATTVNSLNLSSGGRIRASAQADAASLFGAAGALNTLTLTSGALLAEAGNLGISGGAISAGGALLQYLVVGDLASGAYALGSGGAVKSGAGTLTLSQRSLNTAQFFQNEGTTILSAGPNTLLVTPTATTPTVIDLVVNGGVLDLNGNSQAVARLTNTTAASFAANAGTVTNASNTSATLFVNNPATTFAGLLTGNLGLDKSGANAFTLTSASTFTGATVLRGGTLQLQDAGAIGGGGAVSVNFGTLAIVNSGLAHVAARTADSAVALNGGTLSYVARLEGETSATVGALTLVSGANTFAFGAQAGFGGSLNLAAASLSRVANSGAVLNVTSADGQIGRGVSASGGQAPQLTLTSDPTLTNGIIGGWAVFNGVDFLTYLASQSSTGALGLGVMGDTAAGFANYTLTRTAAGDLASSATSNVKATGNFNTNVSGNTSLNSLNMAVGAAGNSLTYGAFGDTLTLASGGFLRSGNFAGNLGQAPDWGRLTTSGAELFLHNNQNTLTVNSRLTGAGKRVVFSGAGTFALANGRSASQAIVTSAGTTSVTLTSTAAMFVGQKVSGQFGGVSFEATISAITDGTTLVLSSAPPAATGFLNFGNPGSNNITGAVHTSGTNTFTLSAANPNLFVGQPLFSSSIPSGTTITAISADGRTITMSANSTATFNAPVAGAAGNSYTGGTVVNNGTTISLTPVRPSEVVVPAGGLIINGGAVNFGASTSVYGAIEPTNNVAIVGGGSLTFPNYAALSPSLAIVNTLAGVSFSNIGGTSTPTLALGTPVAGQVHRLVLTSASAIVAVNDNHATTPTISGGFTSATQAATLEFGNASPVIDVSGLSPIGLSITAAITQNVAHANALTKVGTGSLVLTSGSSTWSTGLTVSAGSLIIGAASTPSAVGATVTSGPVGTGTLTLANGATLLADGTARTFANAVAVDGDIVFGGTASGHSLTLNGPVTLGATTRSINVFSPQVTTTIGGAISGAAGLTKTGNGILVLSNASNSYAGTTTVDAGMLRLGAASAIPAGGAVVVNAGGLLDLNGNSPVIGSLSGAGLVTNAAAGSAALIVAGTGATDVTSNLDVTLSTALGDNNAAVAASRLGVTKGGLGTLTFSNTNSFNAGTILVVAGRVVGSAENTFSPYATVQLGNGSTASAATPTATLDVLSYSQTIGGLATGTNAPGSAAVIRIGAGRTLTTTGTNTLGANIAANDVSVVNFTDGGAFVANGALFQVGGATGGTNSSTLTVDMTALGSFTVNSGAAGIFRLGEQTSGTNGGAATMILSPVNTITANLIGIGDNSNGTRTHVLRLGSGTNVLNANTITLGAAPTGGNRASGTLVFNGASGSLRIRSQADPVNGRANLNMAFTNGTTGASIGAIFDVTGRPSDLRFDVMQLAHRSGTSGGQATATFSFDTGTLDSNDLILGSKATTGNNSTATMTLGGTGAATFNSLANPMRIGVNSGTTALASGTLNLSGSVVTVAGNSGTAIRLGDASAAGGSADGTINLTAGSLTVTGDIIRGAVTGTSTAVLNLDGGTLDLSGNDIGGNGSNTGNLTTVTFASGTLRNVGQFNNGAALAKAGAGVLTVAGTAAYTGATTVSGGTLVLANSSSSTSGITINGGTNTVLRITNSGATGSGVITISDPAVTPRIELLFDGGGIISLPNTLGGNSGITTTLYVDNNGGGGTNGVVRLTRATGSSLGNATLNVTGANGYSLYLASLANSAGSLGAMTFNPTTAALELGNLTVLRATGTGTFVLGGTHSANVVSGVISDGSGASLGGLSAVTKAGTGTWALTGANTYTGATLVSAGTLVAASGALAGTSGITVNGATLAAVNYNASAALTLNSTGVVTISGVGLTISGAVTNANANADALNFTAATGKVTLASLGGAGSTRFGSDADITGGISVGTVTVVGALGSSISGGTVTAGSLVAASITGGSNTIMGAATVTTVNGGTTSIGATAVITTLASGTVNLTGATGTLTYLNGGTLTLAGTALTATSGTGSAALTLNAASTATFSGAGVSLGAVTNANTAADALNFTAAAGKVTLASLSGVGKTRFGSDADITGGISAGDVTVIGALGAHITGGTISAASLTGNVGGGAVTLAGALTGNVTAGTVTAASMTGNVGSSVTLSGALDGAITAGTNSIGSLTSTSVTGVPTRSRAPPP